MTNLSDLVSNSSSHTADITATGTLPNGASVILKADGTIEAVDAVLTSIPASIPAGNETVFYSEDAEYTSISFDPNNAGKFVVCYQDDTNSGYGTAIVGTVSGTSISFGSEYVFNSNDTYYPVVSFDPNLAGKFVVCYRDHNNSGYGMAIVGTVSGTSISFGSAAAFSSTSCGDISISFDPNNAGKFVVCYRDGTNSGYGTAIVGTVSGTSISFGSAAVFNSGITYYTSVAFDPNNAGKFVVCYRDFSNSHYGTACVGTVSGTSISFGSEVIFQTSNWWSTTNNAVAFDPNTAGKFVVCCADTGDGYYGKIYVGTISGTSITFGSQILFNGSNNATHMSVAFNPDTANELVVCYKDGGNSSYGTVIVGTVSGTSISFGSEFIFNAAASDNNFVFFDPSTAGQFVVCYKDYGNSNYGTAIVGQLDAQAVATNLTSDNFIGVSTDAYVDGETATITLPGGVSTNQSGLTAGSTYYVQADGTLATTPSDPSVEVGKAVTPTTLLLKGL
jgi:hypothetical protein